MSLLKQIQSPEDVKKLEADELPRLAEEIRARVIETTAHNGGHIGPNLGVVELTIGLHRVFNTPKDRFCFDVAHQGYVHKLLTGRNDERFDKIRLSEGLSGFLSREESEHDAFGAGHAGRLFRPRWAWPPPATAAAVMSMLWHCAGTPPSPAASRWKH